MKGKAIGEAAASIIHAWAQSTKKRFRVALSPQQLAEDISASGFQVSSRTIRRILNKKVAKEPVYKRHHRVQQRTFTAKDEEDIVRFVREAGLYGIS